MVPYGEQVNDIADERVQDKIVAGEVFPQLGASKACTQAGDHGLRLDGMRWPLEERAAYLRMSLEIRNHRF